MFATSAARARLTSVTALTVEPAIAPPASLRPWSSPISPVPMIPTLIVIVSAPSGGGVRR
jgi:hypothetical protein